MSEHGGSRPASTQSRLLASYGQKVVPASAACRPTSERLQPGWMRHRALMMPSARHRHSDRPYACGAGEAARWTEQKAKVCGCRNATPMLHTFHFFISERRRDKLSSAAPFMTYSGA